MSKQEQIEIKEIPKKVELKSVINDTFKNGKAKKLPLEKRIKSRKYPRIQKLEKNIEIIKKFNHIIDLARLNTKFKDIPRFRMPWVFHEYAYNNLEIKKFKKKLPESFTLYTNDNLKCDKLETFTSYFEYKISTTIIPDMEMSDKKLSLYLFSQIVLLLKL